MAESIRKVVVTWSSWADLIPERSRLEGYEDLEFLISDDKDEIVAQSWPTRMWHLSGRGTRTCSGRRVSCDGYTRLAVA